MAAIGEILRIPRGQHPAITGLKRISQEENWLSDKTCCWVFEPEGFPFRISFSSVPLYPIHSPFIRPFLYARTVSIFFSIDSSHLIVLERLLFSFFHLILILCDLGSFYFLFWVGLSYFNMRRTKSYREMNFNNYIKINSIIIVLSIFIII